MKRIKSSLQGMDTNDLEKHFGGASKAQLALNISRQVWNYWRRVGIPIERQFKIQKATSNTGAPLILGEQKGVK